MHEIIYVWRYVHGLHDRSSDVELMCDTRTLEHLQLYAYIRKVRTSINGDKTKIEFKSNNSMKRNKWINKLNEIIHRNGRSTGTAAAYIWADNQTKYEFTIEKFGKENKKKMFLIGAVCDSSDENDDIIAASIAKA